MQECLTIRASDKIYPQQMLLVNNQDNPLQMLFVKRWSKRKEKTETQQTLHNG